MKDNNSNIKAWEHVSASYVKENNAIYQNKQIDLIKIIADNWGITVNDAYIDDDGVVQLDFNVDYHDTHHRGFMERVEMIMQAQTAFELVEVATFLRKELN
jgi:hypothetical protein